MLGRVNEAASVLAASNLPAACDVGRRPETRRQPPKGLTRRNGLAGRARLGAGDRIASPDDRRPVDERRAASSIARRRPPCATFRRRGNPRGPVTEAASRDWMATRSIGTTTNCGLAMETSQSPGLNPRASLLAKASVAEDSWRLADESGRRRNFKRRRRRLMRKPFRPRA